MAMANTVSMVVHDGTVDEVLCIEDAANAAYRLETLPLTESEYTFSVWARADAPMRVEFTVLGHFYTAQVGTAWQRLHWRVDSAGARAIDIGPSGAGALYLYKAMLEAGDRPSDWQPAFEDMEALLEASAEALGSEIDLTREQIALRVRAEDLEMSMRLKEDGVHIGRTGDFYEARISGESFDILAGQTPVASFREGLIHIGGWTFRATADGGLAQSRNEGL